MCEFVCVCVLNPKHVVYLIPSAANDAQDKHTGSVETVIE